MTNEKTLRSTEELLKASDRFKNLLIERRNLCLIGEAAGVDVTEIVSVGFRNPVRREWERWSEEARKRLPWYTSDGRHNACEYRGEGKTWTVINVVTLKTGKEVTMKEPIFLSLKYEENEQRSA